MSEPTAREGSQRGKGLPESVCVASAKETASALAVDFQITPLASDKGCWKTHMLLWQQNCPECRMCINIVTTYHEISEQSRGENRNSQPCIRGGPKCGQAVGACSQASWLSQLLSGFKALYPPSPYRLEGTTELQAAAALLPCQDFARCNLLAATLSKHCS